MIHTLQAVNSTLTALGAKEYIVRLIHEVKAPINKRIEPAQILEEVSFYQAKNREGYNVYFRPVGYQYVLLDDLYRENLEALASLRPCLLIETSPKNYQAWLRLSQVPTTREEAASICQDLAIGLSADRGSAEPDHIGRLPGFTNRKPKHQRTNGLYPFVKLHKWESRESPFSPQGGIVAQANHPIKPRNARQDHDRSREDFNLCCMLIRQGMPDDYIRQRLEAVSQKALEINPSFDYVGKTIRNARQRLAK